MNACLRKSASMAGSVVMAGCIAWFAWQRGSLEEAITLDIGPVPLNATLDFDIKLHNPNEDPRVLRSVTPGCKCLRILGSATVVPAKGTYVQKVRFTPDRPGRVRADVMVDWDVLPQRTWHIVAEVIPPPEALPSGDALALAQKHLATGMFQTAAQAVAETNRERLIIDVRPSPDFQTACIQGSINMPLAQLSSLPADMRKKPVLVVDRGLGDTKAIEVVSQLRGEGWKDLHLMDGGLPGWLANGGVLPAAMPGNLRLVSADEARQYCTRPGWITVAPRELISNWHLKELMPDLIAYDSKETPDQTARSLAAELSRKRPGAGSTTTTLHVLVATEAGENAQLIAQSLQAKAAGTPVFVLNGGLRGYIDNLRALRPGPERQWTTLADYRGALADLRARQRLVTACSSCPR